MNPTEIFVIFVAGKLKNVHKIGVNCAKFQTVVSVLYFIEKLLKFSTYHIKNKSTEV